MKTLKIIALVIAAVVVGYFLYKDLAWKGWKAEPVPEKKEPIKSFFATDQNDPGGQ